MSIVARNRAVAAAKQWKFEPARMRDRSVSSVYMITFKFRPTGSGTERSVGE
jgi:hypothetical protein